MSFIDEIKARAKENIKTIVLPESEDIRTYKAAEQVLKEGFAKIITIGSEEEIAANKQDCDITGAEIVDPAKSDKTAAYIDKLVELRQKKGMTKEKATEILLTSYTYYGVMMVKMGDADGLVSGACHSTADTLRYRASRVHSRSAGCSVSSCMFTSWQTSTRQRLSWINKVF